MPNIRKTDAQHKLAGTYQKTRHGGRKLQPRPGPVLAPEWIGDDGRNEWNRLAPELVESGALTPLDQTLFGVYCSLAGHVQRALVDGNPVTAAMLTQLRLLGREFGLTPSSRAGLVLPERNEPNPFDQFKV